MIAMPSSTRYFTSSFTASSVVVAIGMSPSAHKIQSGLTVIVENTFIAFRQRLARRLPCCLLLLKGTKTRVGKYRRSRHSVLRLQDRLRGCAIYKSSSSCRTNSAPRCAGFFPGRILVLRALRKLHGPEHSNDV